MFHLLLFYKCLILQIIYRITVISPEYIIYIATYLRVVKKSKNFDPDLI